VEEIVPAVLALVSSRRKNCHLAADALTDNKWLTPQKKKDNKWLTDIAEEMTTES
jgi:hypothetical protein